MNDAVEDAELVRRVASGEGRPEAEREFCRRYGARVQRYAERHVRDRDAASDLIQETLLGVIEAMRAGRIDEPARLGAFVLSTCRYLTWNENRATARTQRLNEALGAEPFEVAAPPTQDLDPAGLGHCLAALPERERSVVVLTYCEDWAGPRIAESLGTTPGNVRVLRHRAIEKLWACLERRADA